jgi:hypothetical protein
MALAFFDGIGLFELTIAPLRVSVAKHSQRHAGHTRFKGAIVLAAL